MLQQVRRSQLNEATETCQLCRVPLITQFYGAFQDAYQIFLVMEYCAGGDLLDRLLDEGRAMSERRVILEVAVPLLKTLQHLHSYSIIHRCAQRLLLTHDALRHSAIKPPGGRPHVSM